MIQNTKIQFFSEMNISDFLKLFYSEFILGFYLDNPSSKEIYILMKELPLSLI
jgi:hypothetical protein